MSTFPPEMMDDQAFLKSLRNREEETWQQAYDRFFPMVQKISTSFVNPDTTHLDLKDIWQESIIALYVQVSKDHVIRDLDNYMYTIILNLFRKKNINHTEHLLPNNLMSKPDNHKERLEIIHKITEDVLQKISKFKGGKVCDKILRASLLREKRDEELAEDLGLSRNYVRVKRSRDCLPKFVELFQKHPWYDDLFGN